MENFIYKVKYSTVIYAHFYLLLPIQLITVQAMMYEVILTDHFQNHDSTVLTIEASYSNLSSAVCNDLNYSYAFQKALVFLKMLTLATIPAEWSHTALIVYT